uniref:Uncharacterized protein n=1 Tax=Cannabis sativa TaxID=3483 RepID=A0A803NUN2_CANSA
MGLIDNSLVSIAKRSSKVTEAAKGPKGKRKVVQSSKAGPKEPTPPTKGLEAVSQALALEPTLNSQTSVTMVKAFGSQPSMIVMDAPSHGEVVEVALVVADRKKFGSALGGDNKRIKMKAKDKVLQLVASRKQSLDISGWKEGRQGVEHADLVKILNASLPVFDRPAITERLRPKVGTDMAPFLADLLDQTANIYISSWANLLVERCSALVNKLTLEVEYLKDERTRAEGSRDEAIKALKIPRLILKEEAKKETDCGDDYKKRFTTPQPRVANLEEQVKDANDKIKTLKKQATKASQDYDLQTKLVDEKIIKIFTLDWKIQHHLEILPKVEKSEAKALEKYKAT